MPADGTVPFDRTAIAHPQASELWVFAYGSLIWKPGFRFTERHLATLFGFHRAFCIRSHRYRGTPEAPGLVLGLNRGGSCRGIAYRVTAADCETVLPYLWEREMVTGVYRPTMAQVRLDAVPSRPRVRACTFVARPDHQQYCGDLPAEETCRIIAGARGRAGPNRDYLFNTVAHLDQEGIPDRSLHALARRLERRITG